MNSQEVTCKCGEFQMWITEGKETLRPGPGCGRRYIGKYNEKESRIDAIEITDKEIRIFKKVQGLEKYALILFYPVFFLMYTCMDIKDSIKNFHKDFVRVFKDT